MSFERHSDFQHNFSIRRGIDQVCIQFESAWRENSELRIEHIRDSIGDFAESHSQSSDKAAITRHTLEELIRVEMDLRFAGNQEFGRKEYYQRFPEFQTVIDQSIERIQQLELEGSSDLRNERETSFPMAATKESLRLDEKRIGDGSSDEFGLPRELGPFQQIERIGAGGFGVVYRAFDTRSRQAVALKHPQSKVLASKDLLNAFLDEAERAMHLDHPGIVKTLAVEQFDRQLLIVQQLIVGTDLKRTMGQTRTQREIAELVVRVAEALAYANRHGTVHRDLTPSNVLLDKSGRPYIADFGMALHESVQQDMPDQRCGTPSYMSPQLVAGLTRNLDGRTDIWSLGVITYELLTGRRPFSGSTVDEIFRQIETRDPKSLREIDNKIDRELERICLKCLARQARDRYLTAGDLAEDLQYWLDRPAHSEETTKPAVFVPKGLRSFGAEDSGFFHDLLPGPRDRDGLPASIRFWSMRICEPVADVDRVPVGIIYGPSGSGKSSFVKAGLIPHIQPFVDACYVESTPVDTEIRLIKALRNQFRYIPPHLSLPEIFAGLSSGRWENSARKILIVIDQFEQELSLADDYSQSELAKALRHCCGERLQCLLLVRDEFWLALTRFADAIEMDLLEGKNSQDIDLFDRSHARRILIKLGQAYGQLPDDPTALAKQQQDLLDETITQLAIDNYVICVRLTLFAEMFKSRPWTLAELESIGGIHGVGETYLEATFGSSSLKRRFSLHKDSVQAVLEALLPVAGSDIRGVLRSEEELLAASQLDSQLNRFENLICLLEQDLGLITRCDPIAVEDTADSTKPAQRFFQLAHDYLVPSIRDWLTTELGQTSRGRARLRLRELERQIQPGKKPKALPTLFEWLTWQLYFRKKDLSPSQQTIMRYGKRHYLTKFLSAAMILVLVGIVSTVLFLNDRRSRSAANLVDDLLGQKIEQTPTIVRELERYSDLVLPKLRAIEKNSSSRNERQRALLGLMPFEPLHATEIIQKVTRPDCVPSELIASLKIVGRYSTGLQHPLKKVLDDGDADPRSRFRAAVSLVFLGHQQLEWGNHSGMLGSVLVDESALTQHDWIELLTPIATWIEPKFREMFLEATDTRITDPLSQALYAFTDSEQRTQFFANRVLDSNDAQFDSILSVFEHNRNTGQIRNKIRSIAIDSNDELGAAARAVALLRLGDTDEFIKRTNDLTNPGIRSQVIILANADRVDFTFLKDLYESSAIENDWVRQAILLALAERVLSIYDDRQLSWLDEVAKSHCLCDAHAGCFSAAELIARRRGVDFMEHRRERRRMTPMGIQGNVFINSQLQAFSIIQPNEINKLAAPIAIATTETTVHEMAQYLGEASGEVLSLNKPYIVRDFSNVYGYCNWASIQDGIGSERIYPSNLRNDFETTKVDLKKSGYRIMTYDEWLLACNSNRNGTRYLGVTKSLTDKFAWTIGTAKGNVQNVGALLPNELGLFDLFGNGYEASMRPQTDKTEFLAMGQTVRQSRELLSHTEGFSFLPEGLRTNNLLLSIRLTRRLPLISEQE